MRLEEVYRELVRPDWAACSRRNVGYFHSTAVICQEAGTVKVCVCVCTVCVCVSACLKAVSRSNAEGEKQLLHT